MTNMIIKWIKMIWCWNEVVMLQYDVYDCYVMTIRCMLNNYMNADANDDFWRYYDDGCICIHGITFDDGGFNPIVWIEVCDVYDGSLVEVMA